MIEYSTLVIDDDVWMQRILSKTLQSYGFKKIFLASNGFDGIALAVEHLPTIIIMDVMMPELSGHLTLKILKKIKTTKNIPVLMVSALSDIENLSMAVKSGSAGFISKPFTRATIFDKLLDVFGKEQLEMISKGEDIIRVNSFEYTDYTKSDTSNDLLKSESDVMNFISPSNEENTEESRPILKQDQLLQHYQDDEKKNIESIRKMLLRGKK
jgi:DNA-binding response OmpR family regulator